jgi:hypothetical protein
MARAPENHGRRFDAANHRAGRWFTISVPADDAMAPPALAVVNAATSRGPEMTCPVVWSTDNERPIQCCGPGATSRRAAAASRVDHSTVRVPVLRLALRRSDVRDSGGEGADLGEQLRQ